MNVCCADCLFSFVGSFTLSSCVCVCVCVCMCVHLYVCFDRMLCVRCD